MSSRRFAYPNRLCDLHEYFGWHYSVISSITNKVMLRLARLNLAQLKETSKVNWASHLSHLAFINHYTSAALLPTSGFAWCKRYTYQYDV